MGYQELVEYVENKFYESVNAWIDSGYKDKDKSNEADFYGYLMTGKSSRI